MYLVVDDAITPEQVEILREAMEDADSRDTVGWNGEPNPGPSRDTWGGTGSPTRGSLFRELLEEDDRFAFLLDNPPVLSRMKAILGNALQLHSASGRVTPHGTPEQNWHRDGPWPQDPDGTPFGSIPGQINCGYYLDELTMRQRRHRHRPRQPSRDLQAAEGQPRGVPGRALRARQAGAGGAVQRLALPPGSGQQLRREAAGCA